MRRDAPSWFLAEVDWYVNAAAGEHGLRAVPLEPSLGGSPDAMDDLRCQAAMRARYIRAALATLCEDDQRILLIAHERISPRRHVRVHAAHQRLLENDSDLLRASAAFQRAWLASGAARALRRAA